VPKPRKATSIRTVDRRTGTVLPMGTAMKPTSRLRGTGSVTGAVDPVGVDPVVGDPVGVDPVVGDPVGVDPLVGDPVGSHASASSDAPPGPAASGPASPLTGSSGSR